MKAERIMKAGFPSATHSDMDYIVWGMTPYPFKLTPRLLYRAASRLKRARQNDITLCDWCDWKAEPNDCLCRKCKDGLERVRNQIANHEAV